MEANEEAVPHIELLRQIQPLVIDGLVYSKVRPLPPSPPSNLSMSPSPHTPPPGDPPAAHRLLR